MVSIEFCELLLAFEGKFKGVKSPSDSEKVIENGDFRDFDSFPVGRLDDKK